VLDEVCQRHAGALRSTRQIPAGTGADKILDGDEVDGRSRDDGFGVERECQMRLANAGRSASTSPPTQTILNILNIAHDNPAWPRSGRT
jgi:hypothetical protein